MQTPKYHLTRLTNLDGWEFHEIFSENPNDKYTIGLRLHVEHGAIEYEVWDSSEKPLIAGTSPYCQREDAQDLAAEHVIRDISEAISTHRMHGE